MPDARPAVPPSLTDRVTTLEELFLHLQRTLQDLSDVLLEQQKRLAQLEQRAVALTSTIAQWEASAAEPRRLEDDKPPHY